MHAGSARDGGPADAVVLRAHRHAASHRPGAAARTGASRTGGRRTGCASTSGGVGPFEWATKQVLLIYVAGENAEEVAIAYAASLHGLVLIPIALIGLSFLWVFHIPLRRLNDTDLNDPNSTDADPLPEPR